MIISVTPRLVMITAPASPVPFAGMVLSPRMPRCAACMQLYVAEGTFPRRTIMSDKQHLRYEYIEDSLPAQSLLVHPFLSQSASRVTGSHL